MAFEGLKRALGIQPKEVVADDVVLSRLEQATTRDDTPVEVRVKEAREALKNMPVEKPAPVATRKSNLEEARDNKSLGRDRVS